MIYYYVPLDEKGNCIIGDCNECDAKACLSKYYNFKYRKKRGQLRLDRWLL